MNTKSELRNLNYEADIGIECHVQLKTQSKLFCGCNNNARDAKPNTLICPICLGMPGSLPVLNRKAIELSVRAGLALNHEFKPGSQTKFDRKNYFYPDLPKGYQITQYDQPIVGKGYVEPWLNGKTFKARITRAHLEEDAGKLTHPKGTDYSLVDLNRAGTPLLEIVSEPDMHSPAEAKAYVRELHRLMRYADVSDVNLYLGNMRFDINVSVRLKNSTQLGTRSETKNLNSFRAVEKAAEYEIKRQVEVVEKGEKVIQETRGWNEAKGKTVSQRSKEEAHDYRYFPEPDLPPIVITTAMLKTAKATQPLLPSAIRENFISAQISPGMAEIILDNPTDTTLLLKVLNDYDAPTILGIAKYLTGKIRAYRNEYPGTVLKLIPEHLHQLYSMQSSGKIGSSAADDILIAMIETGEAPADIAKSKNLIQVSDEGEILSIIERIVQVNQKAVADYKAGNEHSLQFLVGQVMKESKGQANPQKTQKVLRKFIGLS